LQRGKYHLIEWCRFNTFYKVVLRLKRGKYHLMV